MIRILQGTIIDQTETALVVQVQGIGYLVSIPNPHLYQLNAEVTLHTYLAVRETALDLYGFSNKTELAVFEELLTIPKIGPKSALQILNQADLATLQTAVSLEDPGHLTKVAGIGKKTAEKIVQELSNKNSVLFSAVTESGPAAGSATPALQDAIDALVTLGYPYQDVRQVVRDLPDTVTNTNDAVREALKILGQTS